MDSRNISKELEEKIVNCGAFGYTAEKIANVVELNAQEVEEELKNKSSEIYKLVKKGEDMADYVIDLKLFELAKSGDVKAIEYFEKRKWSRNHG